MTANPPTSSGIPSDAAADTGQRVQPIGFLLRRTREGRRLAVADVAKVLRIRAAYLEAIEKGAYQKLPGPAYAVGFVRAYAEFLGLDGEEAVRRFKREGQGLDASPNLSLPMPIAERSIPGGRILIAALVLAVCGYGLWYYVSSGNRHQPELVAEVPASLADEPATPSEAKAAIRETAEPAAAPSRTAAPQTVAIVAPPPQPAAPVRPAAGPRLRRHRRPGPHRAALHRRLLDSGQRRRRRRGVRQADAGGRSCTARPISPA